MCFGRLWLRLGCGALVSRALAAAGVVGSDVRAVKAGSLLRCGRLPITRGNR